MNNLRELTFTLVSVGFVLIAAQDPPPQPEFEAASIRLLPPPRVGYRIDGSQTGGPGTKDPTFFRCRDCNLYTLVRLAFNLRRDQFKPPEWMATQQLLVTAKVPLGATKDEFRAMLQGLLSERFGLRYHFEKKEIPGYHLITAKNGPKLKASLADAVGSGEENDNAWNKALNGKDGFPDREGIFNLPIGRKLKMNNQTMSQFADLVTNHLGEPVVDSTGIPGSFDITLYWSTVSPLPSAEKDSLPPAPSGPSLKDALDSQLGLKLQPAKIEVNVFVIDHIEKTPTEN